LRPMKPGDVKTRPIALATMITTTTASAIGKLYSMAHATPHHWRRGALVRSAKSGEDCARIEVTDRARDTPPVP